jgi:hypothetical protein
LPHCGLTPTSQPLPEAGARHERTLEGVGSRPGLGWHPIGPLTECSLAWPAHVPLARTRLSRWVGEGCEGGVDLAFRGGLQDWELHPLRVRRFLHVSDHGLGIRIVRVHEEGDHLGLGNQLGEQL